MYGDVQFKKFTKVVLLFYCVIRFDIKAPQHFLEIRLYIWDEVCPCSLRVQRFR